MSTSLKLSILNNIDNPEIEIIKETASILEDMIRTVDKGKT